jgi:sulfur transfer protein SufE
MMKMYVIIYLEYYSGDEATEVKKFDTLAEAEDFATQYQQDIDRGLRKGVIRNVFEVVRELYPQQVQIATVVKFTEEQ